jgi:hypothetical protein
MKTNISKMRSQIPQIVKEVRPDLSDWVWHLTRRDKGPKETLFAILKAMQLKGSKDAYSGEVAISFSETPLSFLMKQSKALEKTGYNRLSDFGVGFRKSWLFGKGGLPVIYQPRNHLNDKTFPANKRFLHVDFDLAAGLDYTWQREWRVNADRLAFEPKDVVVLVPSVNEFEAELFDVEVDGDCADGEFHPQYNIVPTWNLVIADQVASPEELNDAKIEESIIFTA